MIARPQNAPQEARRQHSRSRPRSRVPLLTTSIILILILILASLCPSRFHSVAANPPVLDAVDEISATNILRDTTILASDAFEGRAPGSPGEEKTVAFLETEFKKMGLKPGNPDGTYIQEVPLVGVTGNPTASYTIGADTTDLSIPSDCVCWSKRFQPDVEVRDSEVVFVGYGVVAPEYDWDDYKDLDVKGKTLLMLINDPPVPDPANPSKLDEKTFKGRAMTYYGRWTYKFEIAARKGAAAAIIIHETGPAGYPWFVVVGSNSRENFDLASPDRNLGRAPVEGWITMDRARKWLAAAKLDYDTLKTKAQSRNFQPVPLGGTASFRIHNTLREIKSRNVLARIDGSDPVLRNEYIVISSHWDHLGRDPKLTGDQIYNGALDNASGTAAFLSLARGFTKLPVAPRRTLLFLSVTAEEKGLLGAAYYTRQPLYPLERTVANFNIDGINPWGRTKDIEIIGMGNTTLEELVSDIATRHKRVVRPDSEPERGRFFRSDHFEFAKVGVPALYLKGGIDFPGKPKDFGQNRVNEYVDKDYHKVSDEVKADWDLQGAAEDTLLLFEAIWTTAQDSKWPEWKNGSEFKARREAMLGSASKTTAP